jgi:hypothetical protein
MPYRAVIPKVLPSTSAEGCPTDLGIRERPGAGRSGRIWWRPTMRRLANMPHAAARITGHRGPEVAPSLCMTMTQQPNLAHGPLPKTHLPSVGRLSTKSQGRHLRRKRDVLRPLLGSEMTRVRASCFVFAVGATSPLLATCGQPNPNTVAGRRTSRANNVPLARAPNPRRLLGGRLRAARLIKRLI